jgi:hypothetical protein
LADDRHWDAIAKASGDAGGETPEPSSAADAGKRSGCMAISTVLAVVLAVCGLALTRRATTRR